MVRTTSCPLSKGTTDQDRQTHRCVVEAEWGRIGAVGEMVKLGVTARKHVGLVASVRYSQLSDDRAVGRLTIYIQGKFVLLTKGFRKVQPTPGSAAFQGLVWEHIQVEVRHRAERRR